jgi:uncharacterized membrane protein HdeD (DUF308 family)
MVAEIKVKAERYVQKHSTAVLLSGALLVVLGVVGVIDGSFTGFFVTEVFGGLITAAGITQFAQVARNKDSAQEFSKMILSFFYVVTGAVIMFGPLKSAGFIDLLLGIFFIVSGTLKILIAHETPSDKGRSWLYSSAGMSLLLGLFVVASWPLGPIEGFSLSGFLISMELVLTGSSFIIIGWAEKSDQKERKSNIVKLKKSEEDKQQNRAA